MNDATTKMSIASSQTDRETDRQHKTLSWSSLKYYQAPIIDTDERVSAEQPEEVNISIEKQQKWTNDSEEDFFQVTNNVSVSE